MRGACHSSELEGLPGGMWVEHTVVELEGHWGTLPETVQENTLLILGCYKTLHFTCNIS